MMKRIIICLLLVLVSGVLTLTERFIFAEKPVISQNFIRLHVIANSNTEEDQRLKRAVRDAIVAKTGDLFAAAQNIREAKTIAERSIAELELTAKEVVKKSGKPYQVRVKLGHDIFPDKNYGSLHLKAGDYYALQIILGSGQGKNWWCVLFPPLCLTDIRQGAAVDYLADNQDYTLSKIKLKCKIAEFLQKKRTGS